MKTLGLVACLAVGGCTTDLSVSGTVSGYSFNAEDAYFTTSSKGFPDPGSLTFTSLHISSYANACDFGAPRPYLTIDVGAALYTSDPLESFESDVDLSVNSPGRFPISAIDGNRAYADWAFFHDNTGASSNFDKGVITISSVSAEQIEGSLDWDSTDGDHVSGTFSARYCVGF